MKNEETVRILSIIGGYIFFCLGVCIAWAFCAGVPIPILLPRSISRYKLCNGLDLFCTILPATLASGFCVALAIVFGRGDQEKYRDRFSAEMFKQYKLVVVICLICVAVLTAGAELIKPLAANYKRYLEGQEALARDYERNGGNMYRAERFDMAYQYAKLALDLDPDSEVAKRLLSDAGIGREAHKTVVLKESGNADGQAAVSEEGYTVYELSVMAEKAYEKSKWFDAHYYAQTAVDMAEPRDTLLPRLREVAAEAWNRLEIPAGTPQTEEERLYAQKFSGYGALMRGDNLRAYYIFMALSRRSRKMASDPDVVRYLAIAQERMERAYFFIDETIGITDFETANNVHFALKHDDGTTDVIHVKGIVSAALSSGTVQYLRGFSMISLDQLGNMRRKIYDESVKMLSVSAEDSAEYLDGIMELPVDAATVPCLLMRSVDRYDDSVINTAHSTTDNVPNTIVLPMSCEDFELVKEASKGAELMDIVALIKIILKADKYGYSSEVLSQVLLDRLLYPMLILCIFMFLASVAWNFRIKQDIPFQTAWVLSFPVLTMGAMLMMKILLWFYRVMNHVFVGVAGLQGAPLFALVIYVLIFIIASVIFLARNNIDTPVNPSGI